MNVSGKVVKSKQIQYPESKRINFPIICSPLNSKVNTNYAQLEGLELADFDDHYWDVVTGDAVKGESGPTAVSSKLGWLLSVKYQNPLNSKIRLFQI